MTPAGTHDPLDQHDAVGQSTSRAHTVTTLDRTSEQARWVGRPDMLTAAQFSERFRLALATIDNRRRAGRLLGLRPEATRKTLRYPAWQGKMVADPDSRRLFETVLQALGTADSWRAYEFFVTPSPLLSGKAPIDAWRLDTSDALLQAAAQWPPGARDT